jgi:hypothetical protein
MPPVSSTKGGLCGLGVKRALTAHRVASEVGCRHKVVRSDELLPLRVESQSAKFEWVAV